MNLPNHSSLEISSLSSCFNNTSATYKFYWFLSIIDAIENNKVKIEKSDLFAQMISSAWYTVNYFNVSFGKQDKLEETICRIKDLESIKIDESKSSINRKLKNSKNVETQHLLWHFDKQVSHFFLSPWIGSGGSKAERIRRSHKTTLKSPYKLNEESIEIDKDWFDYFKTNAGILKDFCYWNLSLFLQTRNPNVPGISNKLIRPAKRGSLAVHKKNFWDIVVNKMNGIDCIYTGKKLYKGDYVIEHFIPFQFVTHDQMWNLIPADPTFNKSKSAKLPILDIYFDKFYILQKNAIEIIFSLQPKNKFLEDYLTIFNGYNITKKQYLERLEPLISIAQNNGFQLMK